MATLGDLVDQTIGRLNQYVTNRPKTATFNGWMLDGSGVKSGVKLKDVAASQVTDSLVELGTELVHVTSFDKASGDTTCPPWFRQQMGTPANDAVTVGSRAVIDPLWPRFHVAQTVVDGINMLFPDLYGVSETKLLSTVTGGNYVLPANADGILKVTVEDFGPTKTQYPIRQWSFDGVNDDGNRYLRILPLGIGGRPIRVTYRHQAVSPAPENLGATWESTGLPASVSDLPVLYAASVLVASAETAKTQTYSVEQSDRSRLVQPGSATAASRRFSELFADRLRQERRKLLDLYPIRRHKLLNG